MKNIYSSILVIVVSGILSCNSDQANAEENPEMHKEHPGKLYVYDPDLFVSSTDSICNMSIIKGAADTLHINGKIYGFCSSGCKDAFLEEKNTHSSDNRH